MRRAVVVFYLRPTVDERHGNADKAVEVDMETGVLRKATRPGMGTILARERVGEGLVLLLRPRLNKSIWTREPHANDPTARIDAHSSVKAVKAVARYKKCVGICG